MPIYRIGKEGSTKIMIIQCPYCQAPYDSEDKQLSEHPGTQGRCRKCQNTFPIQAAAGSGPKAVRHAIIGHHNEFNKRLQTVAPPSFASPDAVEATTVRGGDQPWLDQGKVISLVVIAGPLKGKIFPVTKPRVLLGRRETDVVLEDTDVSRKHCYLEMHGVSALLVDLGSTNGTFVDDQRIETRQLDHMSEFRVGSTTMILSVREKE
jgi:predicted Zn finger-like uncharacterized protein